MDAITIERGEESGSSRLISPFVTTACTTPDRAKPRTSAHRISHPIVSAIDSAETSACAMEDMGAVQWPITSFMPLPTLAG